MYGPGRRLPGLPLLFLLAVLSLRPVNGQAAPDGPPAMCRIGVNVEDLYELDMVRDTFGATMWLWSVCPSAELEPLAAVAFPTASGSLNLSPIEVVDLPSGGQGTFRYNWDMENYPFDRQRVVIPIDEVRHGAARLAFEPDLRQSFVTPDIRDHLAEWRVSELELEASVSEEPSTYGLPDADGARYARLEVAIPLERTHLVNFLKLTSGVFAGVFIAFLSFFYDPNDRSGFGGKLGLLVGVLFAVLLSLRSADASIGDAGHLTLVTRIHLVTLAFIVLLALIALRDRRRVERGLPVRHPDFPMLAAVGGFYALLVGGIIVGAAWS
jgi:hypothetical protein